MCGCVCTGVCSHTRVWRGVPTRECSRVCLRRGPVPAGSCQRASSSSSANRPRARAGRGHRSIRAPAWQPVHLAPAHSQAGNGARPRQGGSEAGASRCPCHPISQRGETEALESRAPSPAVTDRGLQAELVCQRSPWGRLGVPRGDGVEWPVEWGEEAMTGAIWQRTAWRWEPQIAFPRGWAWGSQPGARASLPAWRMETPNPDPGLPPPGHRPAQRPSSRREPTQRFLEPRTQANSCEGSGTSAPWNSRL